ncbi:MAG TPA: enoyl-CoA hydratase [Acidimicrobiales bacterium]|nr:enoyl-CoA hydratase [Acidimicrobiales bacterium]
MTEEAAMHYERIRYDIPVPGVGRVTLARADKANAQDRQMLYELDEAFVAAMQDDEIKVVVLAADGLHFSSGHDLKDTMPVAEAGGPVTGAGGFTEPGPHGHFATEQEIYVGLCWRWRNLPKPTIAQVQGKVIAGGLMLVWPMDLVVASEDATFSDPTVAFGVNGHEYFTHAWELGARKAKEMLFRGVGLSAEECHRLGMVNHVVAGEDLERFTLALAEEIAARPAMGLKLAKLAVNQSLDAQGQWNAIQAAIGLHHLGHAHARVLHGIPVDPSGAEVIRNLNR